jgi:hypothetical protein
VRARSCFTSTATFSTSALEVRERHVEYCYADPRRYAKDTSRQGMCTVCSRRIPAGAGAFRRGIAFVHVECANKAGKTPTGVAGASTR